MDEQSESAKPAPQNAWRGGDVHPDGPLGAEILSDRPAGEGAKITSKAPLLARALETMQMNFSGSKGIRPDRPPAEKHATDAPPGSPGAEASASLPVADVPQRIELLLKIASLDPRFRKRLLERRAGAAEEAGVQLTEAESAILRVLPRAQLEAIIHEIIAADQRKGAERHPRLLSSRPDSLGIRPH